MFENPRRGRQARHFTENDPKILDLKSSSEQIIFRKLSLGAPEIYQVVFYWQKEHQISNNQLHEFFFKGTTKEDSFWKAIYLPFY